MNNAYNKKNSKTELPNSFCDLHPNKREESGFENDICEDGKDDDKLLGKELIGKIFAKN